MYTCVYMLCVTLCIRSMYNIYIRRTLGMTASLTSRLAGKYSRVTSNSKNINKFEAAL